VLCISKFLFVSRYLMFTGHPTMTANVSRLGDVADFEDEIFRFTLKFN